ncbi:MAG: hypothetical protein LBH10_03345 [Burkholderiaceae bacterium]|jgi:hypothetical protein|nr:hypothetical protein [Burkholderiaceae bacterium]
MLYPFVTLGYQRVEGICMEKSSANILNWLRRICLPEGACAALCASALLAACATPGAAGPDSAATNPSADAQSAAFEDTFRSFSACDAGFFKSLHEHAKTWAEVAPLDTDGDISWIKVENRNVKHKQGRPTIIFSKPPVIAGLKFLSYIDMVEEDDRNFLYFWGFTVEGANADEVEQKLKPLVQDSDRLQKLNNGFTRVEYQVAGSHWLPVGSIMNSPDPGKPIVMRSFSIDSDKNRGFTLVRCTIMDMTTHAIRKDERPDIDPKDYSEPLQAPVDETVIPANVIESLNAARAGNSLWMPKFKKLSYTYKIKSYSQSKKYLEITNKIETQPNGLLRTIRKDGNDGSYTQWITFGDIVTLAVESKRIFMNHDISVANRLKLQLPTELKPGAVFVSETKMENRPQKTNDTVDHVIWKCEVKERINASTIFPTLAGKADRMACQGPLESNGTRVYLEDLGVFIYLGTPSDDGSITQMNIER